MYVQLLGLSIAYQIEMVRCFQRKRESSRRYLQAGVVVIIEYVSCAIAVGGASGDEIILFDMRHSILVDSAVDDQKTFAGSVNDQSCRKHGTAAQAKTDGRADLTRSCPC